MIVTNSQLEVGSSESKVISIVHLSITLVEFYSSTSLALRISPGFQTLVNGLLC